MKLTYIFELIAVILFLIIAIVVLIQLNKESVQCVQQPINYGFRELQKQYNGTLMCTCSLISNKPVKPFIITINETNTIILPIT